MRVIIAGSRRNTTRADVDAAMARASCEGIVPLTVLCGGAGGVDRFGEEWARECGLAIEQHYVTPDEWARYPRTAGHQRNSRMAMVADALVAVWDGQSGGTRDMIMRAKARGLKVYVHRV